ncbi:MAG: hypothetical protein HY556_02370 [Euryarchaeota archaeon]|nr:hypothetical protein [Euryarchaeota archaeon]
MDAKEKPKPIESDYWARCEGIPLMHVPKTAEEKRELEAKGACSCG